MDVAFSANQEIVVLIYGSLKKTAATGAKSVEMLRDGNFNDNLQPCGKSSNVCGVLRMRRAAGLIPSVTALACRDTAALPGYAPPPSGPFTHECAAGIIRAEERFKSSALRFCATIQS